MRSRDWAQALAQNGAGVYIANTGYGYGDFDTIALSERLMTMLAHNLASDGSIGRKLVLAKQQYFASIASYDPYAEKALAEATFYGLPFYRIGTGPEPAPPPLLNPTPTTTPNVAAAPLSFSFTGANALVAHSTPRGKYWSAADGGVEYLKDRPIEPRVSQEVTAVGTQRAHGVLIDALQTHDVAGNIDPLIATPMIDLAAHEPESKVTDVTFPATFASLNHWTAFGQNHDQIVVVPGQTREGTTQRLVDNIDMRVLYSTSTDFTAPLFTQVGSVVNGSTATLFARTSDPAGIPLVRAYFTQGGSSWTFVTLTQQGTSDLYVGTATGITVPKLESAFLAEDGAGNVGYTTDKGFLFISQNGDAQGPQVTIASPINNGVFTLGQPVPASYSCFDDGGVASCVGTRADRSEHRHVDPRPEDVHGHLDRSERQHDHCRRQVHGHVQVRRLLPAGRQSAGAQPGERRPGNSRQVQPQRQPGAVDFRRGLPELVADPLRRGRAGRPDRADGHEQHQRADLRGRVGTVHLRLEDGQVVGGHVPAAHARLQGRHRAGGSLQVQVAPDGASQPAQPSTSRPFSGPRTRPERCETFGRRTSRWVRGKLASRRLS